MNVRESLRTALNSVRANKLRSLLTMLGIIIGVAAVIAMLSIGEGAQQSITNQINSMGTNLLFVRPGSSQQGGVAGGQGSQQTLTQDDANALADPVLAPDVVAVAPESDSFGQVAYGANNTNTRLIGCTPDYASVRNVTVDSGDFFSDQNLSARETVAVLGSNVATTLFEGSDPVGQSIRINGQSFRVIGVLTSKGGSGLGNSDDQILLPLTTLLTRLARGGQFRGGATISSISVQVVDSKAISNATEEIAAILRERHNVLYQDDFTIQSQSDVLASATQITGVLTVFLGGVGAISLLVGGIGIMNIMLVSVTERTREIGIRKAVGARKRDILGQFLTEATLLSLAGGIGGVVVGTGIARLISGISIGGSSFHAVVGLNSILLATLFSMAVGLFFGIYPAQRAASLHPIEALRYE
jgi:putative ABC transport system permease protein